MVLSTVLGLKSLLFPCYGHDVKRDYGHCVSIEQYVLTEEKQCRLHVHVKQIQYTRAKMFRMAKMSLQLQIIIEITG